MFANIIKSIIEDSKSTDKPLTQNDIAEILGLMWLRLQRL